MKSADPDDGIEIAILYLEDDRSDLELVRRHLVQEPICVAITDVQTESEFLLHLHTGGPDLILADYRVPQFSGRRALEARNRLRPEVPFIFLSGHIGEDEAIECLKSGATDYVLKDRLNKLGPAIRRALNESRERAKSQQFQEQLRKAIEFSTQVIESSVDMVIATDLDRRIIVFNPAAEKCFGYAASEVIGQPIELLYSDKEQSARIRAQLSQSGACVKEVVNRRKDGSTFTSRVSSSVLRDDTGAQIGFMGISRDISLEKENDARFLRSQRMEAIGTLAGGVAHDLNNVLAPIAMSTTLLRMTQRGTAEFEKILCTIEGNCQRATDIVRQLLTFSRGVEGKRVAMSPVHGIRQIIKMARQTFPKNIRFSFTADEELRMIRGDPTQLEQVILNLCLNARDAMPGGGVIRISAQNFVVDEVFCRMNAEAIPGDYVLIRVTDTGAGIPAAILHKIFEPFFTTKEQGKGTGLGLSTVLGIVKSHNGFVEVSSTPQQGTTFGIYFPAEKDQQVEETTLFSPLSHGKGELILLVDDEEAIRSTTELALRDFGYRVVTACDGRAALGKLLDSALKIDLVITDLVMPVMDGFALLEMLNRLQLNIPVIASSGFSNPAGIQPSVSALENIGVRSFLQKPYNLSKLLQEIEFSLQAGRIYGSGPAPKDQVS